LHELNCLGELRKVTFAITRWRGAINHVQSNSKRNFTQFTEAVQFMQEQMGKEVVQELFNPEASTAKTEMWSQFASHYQEFMFQPWLELFASPSRLQQAIAQGMKTWQLPDRAEQEAALRTLERLNLRLQALSYQVEEMERRTAADPDVPATEAD